MKQEDDLKKAIALLNNDSVVGMPTETVYGLAASIRSPEGIKKIFTLKERPFFDPLIVHIADMNMLDEILLRKDECFGPLCQALAKRFWPGPLTFILPKNPATISDLITAGYPTVGVRFPAHPVAQALIKGLGHPVAAPSANKFKKTSPTGREHVLQDLPQIPLVLEGGMSEVGIESTIIEVDEAQQKIAILRPGFITKDDLATLAKEVSYKQSPVSPGHLADHYMPSIDLQILPPGTDPRGLQVELSPSPALAARELYGKLRKASKLAHERHLDFIYIIDDGAYKLDSLWESVWDRIKKAAKKVSYFL